MGFKPWAPDFARNDTGDDPFPRAIFDPVAGKLSWRNEDWDPALRFWTLPWDPNLTEWLKDQDASLLAIMAAREFAAQHTKWRFAPDELYNAVAANSKGWVDPTHVAWRTSFAAIQGEIDQLFLLMEDDRDRYMGEIDAQADGLAGYFISFLGIDGERRPWTIELIRCGLAIGNLLYMNYKEQYRRVRPSTICPGLVPPFGPPRHPAFPSGHSYLGHFIALLLLEIPEIANAYGEPPGGAASPKVTIAEVMSATVFKGPLLWLAERLGKNRERAGLHYPSDSKASRWIAGSIWALLLKPRVAGNDNIPVPNATPPGAQAGSVQNKDLIRCPSLEKVLHMAKAEWAPPA